MPPRKLRIMHVEDNDDHAELVAAAISESSIDCQIIRFRDAESGMAYLSSCGKPHGRKKDNWPTLILVDLALPGLSGHDFLRRLRANSATRAVPAVVLTTSECKTEIAAAYLEGANSYIVKPVRLEDFVVRLAEMSMYWAETSEIPEPL